MTRRPLGGRDARSRTANIRKQFRCRCSADWTCANSLRRRVVITASGRHRLGSAGKSGINSRNRRRLPIDVSYVNIRINGR